MWKIRGIEVLAFLRLSTDSPWAQIFTCPLYGMHYPKERKHTRGHTHSLTLTHTRTHIYIKCSPQDSECSISGSEEAPCCTLLSTSRFLMHPLKCLNCSCGYSYDMFSLTPPSCRRWLPFRYLEAESNSKYTKKAGQWMKRTLTPGSPKEKKQNKTMAGCFLPLQDMNLPARILWLHENISSAASKTNVSSYCQRLSHNGNDSWPLFSLKISFSNEEPFAWNS